MTFSRAKWIEEKIEVAVSLSKGNCGGSYAEAVIVLTAAISAIAAELWPGNSIDKKRFVEAFSTYCDPNLNPKFISVPLLFSQLQNKGRKGEAMSIKPQNFVLRDSRVLSGDEVDTKESSIIASCSTLSLKDIRKFSYPCILYEEVRSSYVHEYSVGKSANNWPMSQNGPKEVSYVNLVCEPYKQIHIGIDWMSQAALSIAKSVDSISSTLPISHPTNWWVDG